MRHEKNKGETERGPEFKQDQCGPQNRACPSAQCRQALLSCTVSVISIFFSKHEAPVTRENSAVGEMRKDQAEPALSEIVFNGRTTCFPGQVWLLL